MAARCAACAGAFTPRGRRRYCSAACRQRAHRARHPRTVDVPARVPRPSIVYECPSCAERLLGEQRCEQCNLFCRRVGPGGPCPQCDALVVVADLLEAPEG